MSSDTPRPVKRIVLALKSLDLNGPSFAALNVAADMLSQGCSLLVIACEGGEREKMFSNMGCDVRVFPRMGVPILGRRAVETVRRFEPGIIHAFSPEVAEKALPISHAVEVPLVVTVNRLDAPGNLKKLRAANEVFFVALSDAIRERLINNLSIKREKVAVIPNGINLKYFPAPQHTPAPEESGRLPVVSTYGALEANKGQDDFLRAAELVLQKGIDAEFLVMGHGSMKPQLRELADSLGIGRRLTFSASTITDSRNLGTTDVFVEPSRREGFGMSVLQAMATGVPVIACGVGGIFSLVEDGVTGLLVPVGDYAQIAGAICKLLANRELRDELVHNAREKVQKEFSSAVVAERLMECYNHVTSGIYAI